MKGTDLEARRGAGCQKLTGEALERHLFLCADCRGNVRLSTAWDTLRGDRGDGPPPPASEAFVSRVLQARRGDAWRQRRRRLLLAAAAVLLFFFAAGANSRNRETAPSSAEDVYASLTTPSSALEGLLPD
jgi:hypothetical protein